MGGRILLLFAETKKVELQLALYNWRVEDG